MEYNNSQKMAIAHFMGPCMVLAGPGSGKTTVITQRIKSLVENNGVNPSNILVVTFSKAAAVQMQERFNALMYKNVPVTFGTFHAVYFKIIKYAYNYNAANILREEEKYDIYRNIISKIDIEIDDEKEFISEIINEVSLVKGEMMDINHYYSRNCPEEVFRKIYSLYNKTLIDINKIDFDDMLTMCYELLVKRPDILKLWQEKYKFILIDEFQDISRIQFEIIKMLTLPENNIFIVGDDDQSIYRFRGAKPEIMLNFDNVYKDAKRIVLDTNYRSNKSIVNKSKLLIGNNRVRFQKDIKHIREENNPINIKEFNTQIEECKFIIDKIKELKEHNESYNDIAVIYRNNANPRYLVGKLLEYNIPFKMKDIVPNIYDNFMVRDIISYIKIAMGDDSRKTYLSIINRPKRYIARDAFSNPTVDLDDIRDYYSDKSYVVERIDHFEYDIRMLHKMTPYAAINFIRKGIGYDDFIEEYADFRKINKEELFDILEELQSIAKNYKTYEEWFLHIEEYTHQLKEQSKERMNIEEGVTLTTMHSSKGLEYRNVFILDAIEGVTPHKKMILDSDIEEERRLFYVAMTRARDNLFILYIKNRFGKKAVRSRFIEELILK